MTLGELAHYTEKLQDAAADLRAAALEPPRVGAAYALAAANTEASIAILTRAFAQGGGEHLPVDGVRRSAMYGLAALPDSRGVPALLSATTDSSGPMQLRVCGVFGLGMCADPRDDAAVAALCAAATQDQSAFVRSTAAHMLGFVGRRAAAMGESVAVAKVLESLRLCLDPVLMHQISPWQVNAQLPSGLEEIVDAGATPPDPDGVLM
jgi:HEAT repeat protein